MGTSQGEPRLINPGGTRNLVIMRHGESESNRAHEDERKFDTWEGLHRLVEYLTTLENARLTCSGAEALRLVAALLHEEFGAFDACVTSPRLRAIESALIISPDGGYDRARGQWNGWRPETLIAERDWGVFVTDGEPRKSQRVDASQRGFDQSNWTPAGGESPVTLRLRAELALAKYHREEPGTTFFSTHDDFAVELWAAILGKTAIDIDPKTKRWHPRLKNGTVLHFQKSGVRPVTNDPLFFERWRMTHFDTSGIPHFGEWQIIEHRGKTADELRDFVARFPRVFESEEVTV